MHPREVAIIGAIVLVVLVPWLTVRDIRRQPKQAWRAARRSRWTWMVVVVALPLLGVALYLRVARPAVRRVVTSHTDVRGG